MSGFATALLDTWFVHKASMAPYLGNTQDRYKQQITSYGADEPLTSCRLYDLLETEINTLAQAGILNVSKKLLVPLLVNPPIQTKISNIKTNGKDILGVADVVIDANSYEVVKSQTRRSTVDEYRQLYLRRIQ